MLYVATVHHKSPRWIEIQASHLREHISVPFQTWSSLEGIDDAYAARFDRVLEQRGPLAGKLNHLAREISYVANEDDLIMFLHGDAFPIADPMPVVVQGLAAAPLVAVRRGESRERQPHPCFCVSTVGAWRSLPGDWSSGWAWAQPGGGYGSDFGANLLRALELSGTPWVALARTNESGSHASSLAIYADSVYHHGAGFRDDAFAAADDAAAHKSRQTLLVFEAIERGDPSWLARVREGTASVEGS